VHAEFAGVARRYHSVTMGSLVMDAPNGRMLEMAEGAKAAFEAGLAAVSIGRRIGDAEAAYRDCLNERGLGDCCPMRFGVGISAACRCPISNSDLESMVNAILPSAAILVICRQHEERLAASNPSADACRQTAWPGRCEGHHR